CLDRRSAVPLLGDDEPMLDHSHHRRPPVTADAPLMPNKPARYHIFRFTVASMAALKEIAGWQCAVEGEVDDPNATTTADTSGAPPSVPFISADDAVCAFYWQRL